MDPHVQLVDVWTGRKTSQQDSLRFSCIKLRQIQPDPIEQIVPTSWFLFRVAGVEPDKLGLGRGLIDDLELDACQLVDRRVLEIRVRLLHLL